MPSFNPNFLAPTASFKKHSSRPRDELDDFLSSDLEHSFASTSLEDPLVTTPGSEKADAMDVSPVHRKSIPPKENPKPITRPRAFTSGARLFGTDRSNSIASSAAATPPPNKTSSISSKRIQRSALPTEWFTSPRDDSNIFAPTPQRESVSDDAMDVDTSMSNIDSSPAPVSFLNDDSSPAPVAFLQGVRSVAPTASVFNNLFYDSLSPRRSFESPMAERLPKKRRSASPELCHSTDRVILSSPDLPSSPSDRKLVSAPLFARAPSKPSLKGLGKPTHNLKRPRRPALSAMIAPSNGAIHSAYPILGSDESGEGFVEPLPARRAFSALVPAKVTESFASDESFEGPDYSSPAQDYAKRNHIKTIRRCDGTEDFRPLTERVAVKLAESPSAKFMKGGIPGFGDNEAYGKILPCHRVKDDGLMRITPETMDSILDGVYDSKIVQYQVVDCRFEYEYAGGHIPGAINVKNVESLTDAFFNSHLCPEKPSLSCDSLKPTVLIFHCEFSAKRAPTFAKTLRQLDRSMNNHVYPRIYFPEVYVLEGGYCQYYSRSSSRCEPPAYVTMNDPNHAKSCEVDLSQFRKAKFSRHKSYAFGDGSRMSMFGSGAQKEQQKTAKRNTAPSGGSCTFAAGNAARSRRGGMGLSTLTEDAPDTDTEDEQQMGDSPCPPPTKGGQKRVLGRAATYDPRRF